MKKFDQNKVIAGRSISEILKRFDKKIKDPRSFTDGKKIVKIIKDFLKFKAPLGKSTYKLKNFFDKNNLKIVCKVNGEIRQSDNTNDLIFDIPAIVKYLSEIVSLNVGDVIFTGTPGGVGVMEGKFLKEGDVLTTTIEGLGTLENKCKRVKNHSGVEE